MKKIYFIPIFLIMLSCGKEDSEEMIGKNDEDIIMQNPTKKSYLALGDSYTIGESIPELERWPVVLKQRLDSSDSPLETPKIIAKTGWTTGELDNAIDKENISETYDLVSLLIGVNNQYRGEAKGFTTESYRTEFADLLNRAIGFAGNEPSKVFVVSIPDYSTTPFAINSDTAKIRMELEEYNAIAKEISKHNSVRFFNITPISQEAKTDNSLVASDKLHPSGKMYQRWVDEIILKGVREMLEK